MVGDDDVENARLVLQKAADYHSRLQTTSQMIQAEDAEQAMEMEAEWTVLRIALVCASPYDNTTMQLTSS